MQVLSDPLGKEKVHYEAPKAGRLDGQMYSFLGWFEGKTTSMQSCAPLLPTPGW